MIHKILILFFLLILGVHNLYSQTKGINLERPINAPLSNESNPSCSGDGRTMVLETDYGDERLYPAISKYVAYMWTRPEDVQGIYNSLTSDKGWNLNYNGSQLYFSSNRHGGIGLSDIWLTNSTGANKWSAPENIAKPINTNANEIDPSISPDGRRLYFVRTSGKKSSSGKECGKIYYSEKSGNTWKEPIALPAPVNLNCECAPRILADNKTLLFASERKMGNGGYDLYVSTLQQDATWSNPKNLTFVNTNQDDIYSSMPAIGEWLYISKEARGKDDIFKFKVPEDFRPLPFQHVVSTTIAENKNPLASKISIYNNEKLEDQFFNQSSSGSFETVLSGSDTLSIIIQPLNKGYFYNLVSLNPLSSSFPNTLTLTSISSGNGVELTRIEFSPNGELIKGTEELEALIKTLQDNPAINFKIQAIEPETAQTISDSVSIQDTTNTILKVPEAIDLNNAKSLKGLLVKRGILEARISTVEAIVTPEKKRKLKLIVL